MIYKKITSDGVSRPGAIRCLDSSACQTQKHLPLVQDTDGGCSLKNEAGHNSKHRDVLEITDLSLLSSKTYLKYILERKKKKSSK